ncbi:MAG TPA: HAMP domain-containing sensor histidine kinase [Candidatus Saccharimonadales bacterium]|nr:HAMP domain-containing sensor histidine kinase [Candidatus Saccharimonadales bacterium]
MHRFYNRFITPLSPETDEAVRETVLNYVQLGMFALAVIALLDTVLAPVISQETPHLDRIINNLLILAIIVGLYTLGRYGRQPRAAGAVLTALILLLSGFTTFHWGILLPTGLLLFSLSVVMAGVLIGARYSVYSAGLIIVLMAALQHGQASGHLHPDLHWVNTQPTPGDVIGFAAVLFVIALVSWLFNRQMEVALKRARRSEKALARQRDLLETKAEERAQQLAAAQLDQMQELYRFAELGRLSTALFHDLANHLSTVSLDIEGLSDGGQSDITRRISQNIGHIDAIVQRVRQQLRGQTTAENFNVVAEIEEVLKILQPTARQARVTISVERHKSVKPSLTYTGDVIRFRQIILNLLSNAIEAYPSRQPADRPRSVELQLERQRTELCLRVTDHGRGIPAARQAKIFNPFYTTKRRGTGIGLFIVKQVVEHDFGGSLTLQSSEAGTSFEVRLPKSYHGPA